ncbi:MAG: hypothetical protein L6R43_08795 [Planctomycetes bacterium]|nr:hypothetical protein [Planctomycetota bacterium]
MRIVSGLRALLSRFTGRARQGSGPSQAFDSAQPIYRPGKGRDMNEKERRGIINPPAPTATDRKNAEAGNLSRTPVEIQIVREPGGAASTWPNTGIK